MKRTASVALWLVLAAYPLYAQQSGGGQRTGPLTRGLADSLYAPKATPVPTATTCVNQFLTAIASTGVGTCTTATLASAQFANQGTTTTLLHGNAAGNPSFAAVTSSDLNITTTTCTNQFLSAISSTGTGTCTTDTLAGAQHANQGTTTTLLHGNASGNPAFGAVVDGDLSLTAPALGTPTSVTLTNGTGLPISTGVSELGANVAAFLAIPSSANAAAAITDETGDTKLVFSNTPTITGLPLFQNTAAAGTLAVFNTSSTFKMYISSSTSAAQVSVNRNFGGTYDDVNKASAALNINAASGDGNFEFFTTPTNNGALVSALKIDNKQNSTIGASAILSGVAQSIAAYTTTGAGLSILARSITDTSSSGTVAVNAVHASAAPTLLASSSTTYTDSNEWLLTGPPVASTNVTQTRPHTLAIVDATSAASSITGGLVVATTLGTSATSVGIGGGNINAGGTGTFGGAVSVTGAFTPSATNGIVGTTTNNSPCSGCFGQVLSSQLLVGSLVTLTTNTTATVTSVSLTAGDWDCTGVVDFQPAATTSITNLIGGISTTAATLGAADTFFDYETAANIATATHDEAWVVPTQQLLLASTTTVYLVAQGTFTASSLKAYGQIRCRRMR